MKTTTKAAICGAIFLIMLAFGWLSDHTLMEKRMEHRKGINIQSEFNEFQEQDFAPREYIKIRPRTEKEE